MLQKLYVVLLTVFVHLRCVVVCIVVCCLDVLPPAWSLVLNIQVDGGVDTTQAVEQVVTGDLLEHGVGCACGQLLAGLNRLGGLAGQQLQLAGGQGGDLLQVNVNLLAVHNHVGASGGNELHGGDTLVIQVAGPVVDLDTSDHGVVSVLGVHGLADQVLQILLADKSRSSRDRAAGSAQVITEVGRRC